MIAFEKDVLAEQVHEESIPKFQNVFEAIAHEGHEESFVRVETDDIEPTDLAAGSWEKIKLRQYLQNTMARLTWTIEDITGERLMIEHC